MMSSDKIDEILKDIETACEKNVNDDFLRYCGEYVRGRLLAGAVVGENAESAGCGADIDGGAGLGGSDKDSGEDSGEDEDGDDDGDGDSGRGREREKKGGSVVKDGKRLDGDKKGVKTFGGAFASVYDAARAMVKEKKGQQSVAMSEDGVKAALDKYYGFFPASGRAGAGQTAGRTAGAASGTVDLLDLL